MKENPHIPFTYTRNSADAQTVHQHLLLCDESFSPALSNRVNILDYANKITAKAELFEVWDQNILVGLLAVYCDDPNLNTAFITNVSILPEYQQMGLASNLLRLCISEIRTKGFQKLRLEASASLPHVAHLYHKHGFEEVKRSGETIIMEMVFYQSN